MPICICDSDPANSQLYQLYYSRSLQRWRRTSRRRKIIPRSSSSHQEGSITQRGASRGAHHGRESRAAHNLPPARPLNILRCIVGVNLHPFDCLITNNFLRLLCVKKRLCDIFVIRCPGRKKKIYSKEFGSRFERGKL